jgi:hypothetical protein
MGGPERCTRAKYHLSTESPAFDPFPPLCAPCAAANVHRHALRAATVRTTNPSSLSSSSVARISTNERRILGPSRCFPFWQEVLACYVTNTNSEDVSGKAKCTPYLEDYYECLHHKKEVCFPSSFSPFPHSQLFSLARLLWLGYVYRDPSTALWAFGHYWESS